MTEFCERGSVADVIDREPSSLKWPRRYAILNQVARALQYLHSCSPVVVHGSLKLSNVMLDASYGARLGDFGFNRLKAETGMTLPVVPHVRGRARASGRVCGLGRVMVAAAAACAQYAAPEVLKDDRVSAAADVWSFGVLTWGLATVMRPFDGVSATRVAHDIAFGGLRPRMPGNVPAALAAIVAQCCQEEPGARPSAEALVKLLEEAAGGSGGGGGGPARPEADGGGGVAGTPLDARPLPGSTVMRPGGVGWRAEQGADDSRSTGSAGAGARSSEMSGAVGHGDAPEGARGRVSVPRGGVRAEAAPEGGARGRPGGAPRRERATLGLRSEGAEGARARANPTRRAPVRNPDESDGDPASAAQPLLSSAVDSNAYSVLPRD